MNKILILSILFLGLVSCQTVLDDVPVPEIPQKAVVFGGIEAGSNFHTLRVTKSKPIINSSTSRGFDPIPDAQVTVTSGGTDYVFTYITATEKYEYVGAIDLSSGTVSLEVVTPTLGTLTSEVDVPADIGAYTIAVDSLVREWEIEYAVQFTMPASQNTAYYRMEGYSAYATDTFSSFSTQEYHTNSDQLNEPFKMKSTFYVWQDGQGGKEDLVVKLSSVSKAYYAYGKGLQNYEPDNPFSEPTPLPSNVEGGLGTFGVSKSITVVIE